MSEAWSAATTAAWSLPAFAVTVTVLVTSFVTMETMSPPAAASTCCSSATTSAANVAYWAVGAAKLWPLRFRTTSSDCFQFAPSVYSLPSVTSAEATAAREPEAPLISL